jgi:hypothetical protein
MPLSHSLSSRHAEPSAPSLHVPSDSDLESRTQIPESQSLARVHDAPSEPSLQLPTNEAGGNRHADPLEQSPASLQAEPSAPLWQLRVPSSETATHVSSMQSASSRQGEPLVPALQSPVAPDARQRPDPQSESDSQGA